MQEGISNLKSMFGSHKTLRKEKKMLKKVIFSNLVLPWKIWKKKVKYN